MRFGAVLKPLAAAAAVAACAFVVVGMARATPQDPSAAAPPITSTFALIAPTWPGSDSTPASRAVPMASVSPGSTDTIGSTPGSTGPLSPSAGGSATTTTDPFTTAVRSAVLAAAPSRPAQAAATTAPAPARGGSLPLGVATGSATEVITVVASSPGATTATLQAWSKAPGGGWIRYGPAVAAHVGSDGLTTSPSESRSATPIGSFTLTQAFGHDPNPGTKIPYLQTTPADWWISQPGPLYNTHQRCSSGCAFAQGDPNEHLYYETPFYDYAVVIDYNTADAGPVRQGAGSAFFLHVTDGTATAGCVAIPMTNLVTIMRWLDPAAHPRILIGIA